MKQYFFEDPDFTYVYNDICLLVNKEKLSIHKLIGLLFHWENNFCAFLKATELS
jgi:hypothetical protein